LQLIVFQRTQGKLVQHRRHCGSQWKNLFSTN